MTNMNSALPPLTERSSTIRWLRKNLFASWSDSVLTILGILFVYWVLKSLLIWVFTVARWEVVSANLRLIMIGQYPITEVNRLWLWLSFQS